MVLHAKPKAGKVVKPLTLLKSYSRDGNTESTLFNEANWGVVTQKYMGIVDNRLRALSFTKVIQMTSEIIRKTTVRLLMNRTQSLRVMLTLNNCFETRGIHAKPPGRCLIFFGVSFCVQALFFAAAAPPFPVIMIRLDSTPAKFILSFSLLLIY